MTQRTARGVPLGWFFFLLSSLFAFHVVPRVSSFFMWMQKMMYNAEDMMQSMVGGV